MNCDDTSPIFPTRGPGQNAHETKGVATQHCESEEGVALKKRERSAYFKAYNAARHAQQKAYHQQPEQRAKAKLYAARLRARVKLECPPRPPRIRKPRPKIPKKPLLTKEEKAARFLRYRMTNRTEILEGQRKWREQNREREKLRARQYRLDEPEKSREIAKRYHATHPTYSRCRAHKRRAVLLGAAIGNQQTIKQWEALWRKKRSVRCFWCERGFSPKECHTDHIQPLAKGGKHSIENLCISCSSCNQRKHDKLPVEWNNALAQPVLI